SADKAVPESHESRESSEAGARCRSSAVPFPNGPKQQRLLGGARNPRRDRGGNPAPGHLQGSVSARHVKRTGLAASHAPWIGWVWLGLAGRFQKVTSLTWAA